MSELRPFRFGVQGDLPASDWIAHARRAEELGYNVLSVGDHVFTQLAPIPALMAGAMATSTIRLGTVTMANDFRNPVILARDVATLDALSGGRAEFGLGSGFLNMDYAQLGIPFDTPAVRLNRLFEGVRLVKSAFRDEAVDFVGTHYNVKGLSLTPKPIQQPAPPMLVGGGGKRVLQFAVREANIVSLNMRTTAEGQFDWSSVSAEATKRKVEWVREAAGSRFDDLELHVLISRFEITEDPEAVAHAVIARFADFGPVDLTVEDILASPHFLIGSEEAIAESIQMRRKDYGISYISVFAPVMETFAPIAARLAAASAV